MDTLSVFSSFIQKMKQDKPLFNKKFIDKWTAKLNKKFYLKTKKINLANLRLWKINDKDISHTKQKFFSIIGIKVKTNKREIKNWTQPIIQGSEMAFSGFIIKEFNKTNHYLCRYILKPGSKTNTFSCTANTSNIKNYMKNKKLTKFQKKLMKEYFFNNKTKKLYNNILSDEGGRFFHSQINYISCKLKNSQNIKLPSNYIWLSTNQIIDLIKKKKIDIEARLLFGILNFKETI